MAKHPGNREYSQVLITAAVTNRRLFDGYLIRSGEQQAYGNTYFFKGESKGVRYFSVRQGAYMEVILRGGCLCGAVRDECAGDPSQASYCHCDDCRKATGGPYTVGVLVRAKDLRIVSGRVKSYTSIADSGRKISASSVRTAARLSLPGRRNARTWSFSKPAAWTSRSSSGPTARPGRKRRSLGVHR